MLSVHAMSSCISLLSLSLCMQGIDEEIAHNTDLDALFDSFDADKGGTIEYDGCTCPLLCSSAPLLLCSSALLCLSHTSHTPPSPRL